MQHQKCTTSLCSLDLNQFYRLPILQKVPNYENPQGTMTGFEQKSVLVMKVKCMYF